MSAPTNPSSAAAGIAWVIAAEGAQVGDLLVELDALRFAPRRVRLAAIPALARPPAVALVVGPAGRARSYARRACGALGAHPALRHVPIVVVMPAGRIPAADAELDAHELIVRPLHPGELLSRIERSMASARASASPDRSVRAGSLRLDPCSRSVWIDELPVPFSVREFELLVYLVGHPARVHSRTQMLRVVWHDETGVGTRAVDVQVRRVRAKLGDLSGCIRTVRRVGYAFTTPS